MRALPLWELKTEFKNNPPLLGTKAIEILRYKVAILAPSQ